MEKDFNKASRRLFSSECPISECHEGKPSDRYVNYKFYESYFNLLDRFAEFKPQFDAINKGHKAWSSEFEIDGCKYEVKTLDNLVSHNFENSESASFSQTYLPDGYIRVEKNDEDVEIMPFAEFYEDIRKNPDLLNKFDEEFVKAEKTNITAEYVSDLRIILANTLSPMHAVAANEEAFGNILNLFEKYHPHISNFLAETYNSCKGISKLLEHQAGLSFEERKAKKAARPETLEDVLESSQVFKRIASFVKKASITIPGLLLIASNGAAAIHSSSSTANEHHDGAKVPYESTHDGKPMFPPYQQPAFSLSEQELVQGTPQNITNPLAGDDNNVANNHANGLTDLQQFITADGKRIIFSNNVTGPDGFIYREYWLYYTDNPAYVIAPGFKDHHAHDWEAVIDKCTSDGKFVERATSYHVKLNGLQLERGWKFTNDNVKMIIIESAGHAMSVDAKDFFNPFDLVVKDPTNNEDLHPTFHPSGYYPLLPECGENYSHTMYYKTVDMQHIIDDSQLDANERYKTDGYPEAASANFGDASKVPWKSAVYSAPWQIFDDKGKSEAKTWQNKISGDNLEARIVAKGSRLVLGEENGIQKADIPGVYVKSGNEIFLASDFTNSYSNAQLEIYGKESSHYKITMYVTKNIDGQSVAEEKTIEKDVKKGETQIIKLNSADLQPAVIGDNSQSSEPPWGLIGAGIAGLLTALGLGSYLLKRRKQPPKPLPQPFYPYYPYPQQFNTAYYQQAQPQAEQQNFEYQNYEYAADENR